MNTHAIRREDVQRILDSCYDSTYKYLHALPGELDYNFALQNPEGEKVILKVSRPGVEASYIDFQSDILSFLKEKKALVQKPVPGKDGRFLQKYPPAGDPFVYVRMVSWVEGRLWSSVNPLSTGLRNDLGREAGKLTRLLQGYDHPQAHRTIDWDLAGGDWVRQHMPLFEGEERDLIGYYLNLFDKHKNRFDALRKGVVHNDLNDNNIIVTSDLIGPRVSGFIDFGDSVYTQLINDLAIAIAYGVMGTADSLRAASEIVEGYHASFPLEECELEVLYTLVAMRLVISVTKSALNRSADPKNAYLQVSEESAWKLLYQWREVDALLAWYSFREACGYAPVPLEPLFREWVKKHPVQLKELFPAYPAQCALHLDLSVSSPFPGHEQEYMNDRRFQQKIRNLQEKHPDAFIAGGYLETRPFYYVPNFEQEGNQGKRYRTEHLGIDVWLDAGTAVHAPWDATVYSIDLNEGYHDYGPTLILEHDSGEGWKFYSLYGHLSESSLHLTKAGQKVKKGEKVAFIGKAEENGNWSPHLHFQLMLDMLGMKKDFPGVGFADETALWSSVCPDPNLAFGEEALVGREVGETALLQYRRKHLGKSLSLSYDKPLHMVRGLGPWLVDQSGRKFLDTVNNVAHVGHEHPRVVEAGRNQMAILNTNTRYLHENIVAFAKELLETFPPELSVVHFVNSGSEANELALRMAYACSGQKDMIAVEVGYHGNTTGCVDVSSYKFDGKGGKGAPEHTHIVPLPDRYRGIYRDEEAVKYAGHIQQQIDLIHQKGRKPAGFICESILSCGGQIELPEGYLQEAAAAIREAGGLYIADEVQVGVGRVGKHFWGFELQEVIPDIVTIGKPLGNGHPLAAVVCTADVAEAFANGMEYFNTFGGNPVSCAIGREVLRVVKEEGLQENALKTGEYLKAQLRMLQDEYPVIGDVRGQGLFLGFELVDTHRQPRGDKASYLANRMRDLGVLMSTDGREGNVLKIKPPLVFGMPEAEEFIYRMQTVLQEDFIRKG